MLLGCWINDGTNTQNQQTYLDDDIKDILKSNIYHCILGPGEHSKY